MPFIFAVTSVYNKYSEKCYTELPSAKTRANEDASFVICSYVHLKHNGVKFANTYLMEKKRKRQINKRILYSYSDEGKCGSRAVLLFSRHTLV